MSSSKSAWQVWGIANNFIWKEYRIRYDGIMENEIVRRTTLSFVAFYPTPVIYPMRQVQDNYDQLRVIVHKRASESYILSRWQRKGITLYTFKIYVQTIRRNRGQSPSTLEKLHSKLQKSIGGKPNELSRQDKGHS